jgi:hypothetical protein
MKYNYSNLQKIGWGLFSKKSSDRLYKQTLDLKISSNEFNFKLLEYPRTRKYLESPFKGILGTCYYNVSNILNLDFIKGISDPLLSKLSIHTSLKLTKEEYSTINKNLKFDKIVKFYYDHLKKYPKGRTFYVFNKHEKQLLKSKKGFRNTWFKTETFDVLLGLESFGFKTWISIQKHLSLKELTETLLLHNKMRSLGGVDYSKELLSGKLYFAAFERVLKNYPFLWLSTLNSWKPNYYTEKYDKIIKSLTTLEKYIKSNKTHGTLQNVWIESPKGKFRLICIPNFAYRWYCRMWNDALSVWCKPRIHPNFHGFIYRKGCLSWWKDFIRKDWENYDNIYEFDMASFFPNVNRKEAYEALLYFDVPKTYARHLIDLVSGEIQESTKYPNAACFYEETLNREYRNTNRNLPMGNALCPLLSTLVLYKHFDELGFNANKDLQITGYADDNMLLCTKKGYLELETLIKQSNKGSLEEFLSNSSKGIFIEKDKSGWIKSRGSWLKGLKNLGLELQPIDYSKGIPRTLQGKTRGTDKNPPSVLPLLLIEPKSNVFLTYQTLRNEPKKLDKYFGFIQSRLYIGKWQYDVVQNFNLEDSLIEESFGKKFGKFNYYNRKKFNLNIRNFSSYLNARLFRFMIFKRNIGWTDTIIWKGETQPSWKKGNDNLYFKKYKEMSIQISQLKFEETWLFYRLKKDGLYVSFLSPLKVISAPKNL